MNAAETTKLESIVKELKNLPPAKLEKVARYVQSLRISAGAKPDAILRQTSGIWSPVEGDRIEKAIQEGCERIDARDW